MIALAIGVRMGLARPVGAWLFSVLPMFVTLGMLIISPISIWYYSAHKDGCIALQIVHLVYPRGRWFGSVEQGERPSFAAKSYAPAQLHEIDEVPPPV